MGIYREQPWVPYEYRYDVDYTRMEPMPRGNERALSPRMQSDYIDACFLTLSEMFMDLCLEYDA